ncbi:MAG: hypothetical protein E7029_10350 [Planctomycetaceae bacterium]|nr:hypothetical protein [Planctomycetaceae bacterium]
MKKAFQLMGLCLPLAVSAALAADWDVAAVSKQSSAVPNAASASEETGKFLHVKVDVTGNAPSWNKFKVVNEQGEEVAAPAGYNPKQGLVVFEGDWTNMIGRYLENGDQRIPLFQKEAPVDAAPEAVVVQETPVQPVEVAERAPVVVDRPVEVVERDPVVVRDRVVRDDVVHVYDDHDRVVVHDDHDDVVVHHHGGHGVVHHDGHDVVHHHGGHGHGVVHHGDGDVHHVHDGVAHGADCGCDDCAVGAGGHGGGAGGGDGAAVAEASPWDIDPLGRTLGMAGTVAMGDKAGVGGFGSGYGVGYGYGAGPGNGPGTGDGTGTGPGDGAGPGDGPGNGDGTGEGSGEGNGEDCGCEGPEEGPEERAPKDNMNPGQGPGAGGNGSMSNYVNLAPQYRQRVRNLAPKMELPEVPVFYGPDILVYNPQIPHWNPQLPYYNPGYGYGGGGGGGYGNGGGYGDLPTDLAGTELAPTEMPPGMVLYISCGDLNSTGKVYQVDEQGRVLGVVNLPHTATGLAMHRDHGLVCVCPRDGGKIYRISDGGIVEPIMEKDEKMAYPVDVAVAPGSDSMVLVDNMTDTITMSNVQGKALDVYKKIEGIENADDKDMSVAVGRDRAILFGSSANDGIYRFTGNGALASSTPVLPESGGVAADPASDRWAATQGGNRVVVMEGENEVASYELPGGKRFYRQGLVSFAPPAGIAETTGGSGVVVAMRDADNTESAPYLIEFKTKPDGKVDQRLLFDWKQDEMVDFVVGPRMLWEQNNRETYKSLY